MTPRIFADFHNLNDENWVRLDGRGTVSDLKRLGVQLAEGLAVTLYTDDADETGNPDDLLVNGVVRRGPNDGDWLAEVNWASLRHSSDEQRSATLNGQQAQTSRQEPV